MYFPTRVPSRVFGHGRQVSRFIEGTQGPRRQDSRILLPSLNRRHFAAALEEVKNVSS